MAGKIRHFALTGSITRSARHKPLLKFYDKLEEQIHHHGALGHRIIIDGRVAYSGIERNECPNLEAISMLRWTGHSERVIARVRQGIVLGRLDLLIERAELTDGNKSSYTGVAALHMADGIITSMGGFQV